MVTREPGHPVPMPESLLEGRDKMVESSLPEIHRCVLVNNIITASIIISNRLHKDVIHPGLSENLNNPEGMMEMFEHQAERMKTVYTKYLSDHMKVSTILKNDLTKIFRFPIL